MKYLRKKKIYTVAIFLLCALQAQSQVAINRARHFMIGVKGGVNFTQPVVYRSYSVLTSTPQSANGDSEKQYDPLFLNPGGHFGLIVMYGVTDNLSIVFQPTYFNYNFRYHTDYSWTDTLTPGVQETRYEHVQNLYYFEFPLMARWDFTRGRFSPYLQAGGFVGVLHTSNKYIRYFNSNDAPVPEGQELPVTPAVSLNQNINTINAGVIGGAGVCYNSKYVQIGLECNFRYGLTPITDPRNRYSDVTGFSSGYFDVLDDLSLMNLEFSLTACFPIGVGGGENRSKPYCSFETKKKNRKKGNRKR